MKTYAVIYVKGKGYWCGGHGEDIEFSRNIEGALLLYSDAVEAANKSIKGDVEYINFNQSMQASVA